MKVHQRIFKIVNSNGKTVEKYDLTGHTDILINTTRYVLKNNLKYGQQLKEIDKVVNQRKPKPQRNIVADAMNFNVQPQDTSKIGFKRNI